MRIWIREWIAATLMAAVVLSVSGCAASAPPEIQQADASVVTEKPTAEPTADRTETSDAPQTTLDISPTDEEIRQDSLQTKYVEILSGADTFFSNSYQKALSIDGYLDAFASETGTEPAVTKYTVLDMDGDAVPELLLWVTVNEYTDYGTMVLRYQKARVEEYTFAYRQLFDLKADGSFALSGSEPGSGFARLQFDGDGWQYREIPDDHQDEKTIAQWQEYPSGNFAEGFSGE